MSLWVPPSARISKADEKAYKCMSCGDENADLDHVLSCSKAHEDVEHQLVKSALNRDGSIWNGLPVDAELEGWIDQHRKALREGKMKL